MDNDMKLSMSELALINDIIERTILNNDRTYWSGSAAISVFGQRSSDAEQRQDKNIPDRLRSHTTTFLNIL